MNQAFSRFNRTLLTQFLNFIRDGDYEVRNRNTDGPPVLYRFTHPANVAYPEILELFSRADDRLILKEDQQIIPIQMNETQYLSAILLNETYYDFLLQHCHSSKGIQIAEGEALIPFKARAWLDLKNRKDSGEQVEEKDIKKHRNDVFKLALTLSGKLRAPLPFEIAADLRSFLQKLPIGHEDWPAILISIKSTIGGTFKPSKLISEIQTYYQLSA